MKKHLKFTMLATLSVLLYSCPSGLDYPLGTPGSEKIDPALLGTWEADDPEAEVLSLKISRKDDYSYRVEVLERGAMYEPDTDLLTGWMTTLEGKKFIFFRPDGGSQYHHYMLREVGKDYLITCDVSLLDGGVDAVISTASLRAQVKNSMKRTEFCESTIRWTRE